MSIGIALAAVALVAPPPARATVVVVYSCAGGGDGGNHDAVDNGFFVQNVVASNVHSVAIPYATDTSGNYTLSLTVRRGSYAGPIVGSASTNTFLSTSFDSTITYDLGDAAITSGDDLYFTHTASGPGNVSFELSPSGCPGNEETVGTSGVLNGFSVAVTITQNTAPPPPPPPPPPSCSPSSTVLCTDDQPGDRRFKTTVTYATSQGGGLSGNAHAVNLSSVGISEGGIFWFFDAKNPELLIKVLNGCAINHRYWIYFSAGTNVGFHVTVTDMQTNQTKTYTNADLTEAAPVQDVNGLPCS